MGSRAASLVREATDIVSLISEVTRSGGDAVMALCRLHADKGTHSLSISGQGVYNCFRCGARGGTLTFVQGGMSRGGFGGLVGCPCGVLFGGRRGGQVFR